MHFLQELTKLQHVQIGQVPFSDLIEEALKLYQKEHKQAATDGKQTV
jgi:type II secretory pathway predicted ATPase ExeA